MIIPETPPKKQKQTKKNTQMTIDAPRAQNPGVRPGYAK